MHAGEKEAYTNRRNYIITGIFRLFSFCFIPDRGHFCSAWNLSEHTERAAAFAAAPVRSVADQLVGDGLSDPGADGVHAAEPFHLVPGFEGLGDALGAGELGGQLVRHLPGLLVDLREMSVQLAVVEQGVVEGAAVLLQVVRPPSAPQAQGRRGGLVLPGDQVAVAHQFVVEAGPVITDKAFHSVLLFGHIALGRVRGG